MKAVVLSILELDWLVHMDTYMWYSVASEDFTTILRDCIESAAQHQRLVFFWSV